MVQPHGINEQVRARLQTVLAGVPQADIARQTGSTPSNVSRYLSERKVPVEFCYQVAKAFDVNPTWLILGEGTPRFSDISDTTKATTSHLLELVDAMNAVSRMKLGSLVGKSHLKALKELNSAYESYESYRQRLNGQTAESLRETLEHLNLMLEKGKYAEATRYLQAAKQLMRFCDDKSIEVLLLEAEVKYALHMIGDIDTACDKSREIFCRRLADPDEAPEALNEWGHIYAYNLYYACRIPEAFRILKTLRAFVGDEVPRSARLELSIADCELQLGNVQEAVKRAYDAIHGVEIFGVTNLEVHLLNVQLTCGHIPLETVLELKGLTTASRVLCLRHALLNGKKEVMEKACHLCLEDEALQQTLTYSLSKALLMVFNGKRKAAIDTYADLTERKIWRASNGRRAFLDKFASECTWALLHHQAKMPKEAQECLLRGSELLAELPQERCMPIIYEAIFSTTMLNVIPADTRSKKFKSLRNAAFAFLETRREKGCVGFPSPDRWK